MRFISIALLLVLVLTMYAGTGVAQNHGVIRGEILYPNNRSCGGCPVYLESMGSPAGSVLTDSFGRFMFTRVKPGRYQVRVSIDGFEEIELSSDIDDAGFTPMSIIILAPKRVVRQSQEQVVDVSAFSKQYPEKAVALHKKALKNEKRGNVGEAMKQLEEAVQIAPDFYQAHVDLGLLYPKAGRFDDAEKEFRIANGLNQSSADPLTYLSRLYNDRNEPALAVEAGEEAVKKNARSPNALFNLGLGLYRISRLDSAENVLRKALSFAPHAAPIRLLLANVYAKLRDWDNLQMQLDSYLEENPRGEEREAVQQVRERLAEAKNEDESFAVPGLMDR